MNAYQVTLNKESAIRQWQNILAFGTPHKATQTQPVHQQQKVTFEVLP